MTNFLDKKGFEKSNKAKIPKSKISGRSKKLYKKLYNEKNNSYSATDILNFYNSLCKDFNIPLIQRVVIGKQPLKSGRKKHSDSINTVWGIM